MNTIPPPDPSRREQIEALHEEVDRLPEKYRAAVVLCHLEGRTHAEAARMLNFPVGTVSIRLSRARERLRARLTRRGVALPAALAGALLRSETVSAAMPAGLAPSTIKAVMHLAAGKVTSAGAVPAAVAQLAEGEIKIMFLNRLTMAASGVLAVGFVTAGVGWLAAGEPPDRVGPGVAPVVVAAPPPEARDDQEARLRARSMNNFKSMGLAMHNYANQNEETRFPPAAISRDGKPLLSWRVALLHHIDEEALYEKFHLDEPWDSPHNKELLKEMPEVYAPVVHKDEPEGSTYYQVFVGPGALFEGDEGTRLAAVRDGTAFTLMIAEAAEPVPWTKPEDIPFDNDEKKPLPTLGGQFESGFHVVFGDGSAMFLSKKIDPAILRALITRDGREILTADKLRPYNLRP